MEDNEIQEGGISLGQIFRTIFSQKWLALILVVVITLAGFLGIHYGLNARKRTYSVSFVYRLPNSGDSPVTYSYPDGKIFRFTDMVTSDNLNQVKLSNSNFTDIDVDSMVKNGDIEVIRKMEEVAEGSNVYEATYNLRVKAKYFKSSELAKEFLLEVTQLPVNYLRLMNIDYDTYLTSAAQAETYDAQLSNLQRQVDYISSLYSSFISSYGGSFMVNLGDESAARTLAAYKAEIDTFNSNNRIEQLKNEALENGYVKNERSIAEYESRKFQYEEELKVERQVYNDFIELLENNQSPAIFDNPQIIDQLRKIYNLEKEIYYLDQYIDNYKNGLIANQNFNNSVEEFTLELEKYTKDVAAVAGVVYETASTVSYADTNIIVTEGTTGTVMSLAISFVAGLIIAAIVAYIVGYVKNKKSVKVEAGVPVFAQAQAQAAVSEDEQAATKDETKDKEDK